MASVRRIVAEYEISSPLALGIPARTLREGLHVDEELADISISEMQRSGEVESHGPLVRKTGWLPSPTQHDVEICNHLVHDICAGAQEPPSVEELVSRFGNSVPGLLRFLERQGQIVQVETDRYYGRGALESMILRLKSELVSGQQYVPAQLRDVLGSSRKYLIPFLEYCDRNGITERRGEGRVLRQTSVISLDTFQAHS
jgi:selenocysteine-specific elongation factor